MFEVQLLFFSHRGWTNHYAHYVCTQVCAPTNVCTQISFPKNVCTQVSAHTNDHTQVSAPKNVCRQVSMYSDKCLHRSKCSKKCLHKSKCSHKVRMLARLSRFVEISVEFFEKEAQFAAPHYVSAAQSGTFPPVGYLTTMQSPMRIIVL